MANTDAPSGATPVGANGSAFSGQVNRYVIPATDGVITAIGDIVSLDTAGSDTDGVMAVSRSAVGEIPVGIVVGFEWPDRTYEDLPSYRPASTKVYALVADDPNVQFVMQEDSVGAAITSAEVGENTDLATIVNANATTGKSQMELDSSIMATTATLVINVKSLYQSPDNVIGDNAKWLCGFNVHQFGSVGTAGI